MKAPTFVDVGPFRYGVAFDAEKVHDFSRTRQGLHYGYSDHFMTTIYIDDHASITQQRDTLWHEVLHCAWRMAPNYVDLEHDEDIQETVVSSMATLELEVMRRNPELMTYLCAKD